MNDIRTLLHALGGLLGHATVAPYRWHYEYARAQGAIALPPPARNALPGPYRLGQALWKYHPYSAFGLHERELPQHVAIYGRSGAGKTNCAFLLIHEITRHAKPYLLFDWKQTYRVLTHSDDVQLYTPGHETTPFHFNPLHLNSIASTYRDAYFRHLVSVLLNVYFRDLQLLSVEGVEYLLLRGFDALKQAHSTFHFGHLYTWLVNYKATSRERDWKSSALNVLYKLTTGPMGQVLNHSKPISIEQLVRNRTVIELHWLGSPKDKTFLMQALLLQLYYHFSRLPPTASLRYFILIEEAHNVLLRHTSGYETIIEMVLRQVREYGVSLCLLDQHPSLMSLPALGTFCTIAFNLRTPEDIRVMGSTLNLGTDSDYLSSLPMGQAIVKIQDRSLKPFLVSFPRAHLFHAPIDLDRSKDPEDQQGYFTSSRPISPDTTRIEVISSPDKALTQEEKYLLIDLFRHPLEQTAKRYRRLGWNPRKGNTTKNNLLDRECIQSVDITTRRGRIRLFELTPLGRQHLREWGIYPEHGGRLGSLLHQFWCTQLKNQLESEGFRVVAEYPLRDKKAIDLVASKGSQRIAIEIETGKSDPQANVEKCIQAGFQRIILVGANEKVKAYLEALVMDMDVEVSVEVQTVATFSISHTK